MRSPCRASSQACGEGMRPTWPSCRRWDHCRRAGAHSHPPFPQPERLEATRKLLTNLERHWRLVPAATPRTRQLAQQATLAIRKTDFVRGRMPAVPDRKPFQYVPMPGLLIGDTEEAAKAAAAYFSQVGAG